MRRCQDSRRPDDEHQEECQRQPRQRHVSQLAREDEQAEHDEDRDLREESEPFVEGDELAPVARRRAPDRETDEVDGEKAAAPDHVRGAEGECAGGDRRDGGEGADRVREPSEDPDRGSAEHGADEQPETELLDDQQREVVEAIAVRLLDPRDQSERQRDSHRVVAARLRFERAGQRAADVRAPERREDRGRVGGRDDGAEKDRPQPGEVEEHVCGDAR